MEGFRDWVFSQLKSNFLILSTPLSGGDGLLNEEPQEEELAAPGSADTASSVATPASPDISLSSNSSQENHPRSSLHQDSVEGFYHSNQHKMDRLDKVESLQIKLLRSLQRLGQSPNSLLVAKVLYRLHLATLIRAGESDMKRVNLRNDRAKRIAAEQEADGLCELDFSVRVLVLGRTGVGKSATINSIFDENKTMTNAFAPATDRIQEVSGTCNGIKITFIDTPGFLPSSARNFGRNRKIMLSVKRFIRKSPPDMVLYFERLDLINTGYSDFPILKLITEVFGNSIWFNTILVMTHSSVIHEGFSYESNVTHCTDIVQRHIHQAVLDAKLEMPILTVENDPHCKVNTVGEKVLPDGQVWRSQLLLLCICTKVLGDANSFLGFHETIKLGPLGNSRQPSLPHLLSSLLRHQSLSTPGEADEEIDNIFLSELDEEDEYDQLPPIRVLSNAQFQKLNKSQKNDYLDELDYRETLYLKKQLKEASRSRKQNKNAIEENLANGDDPESQYEPPETVSFPESAVPPTFDSYCPLHRYRWVVTSDQWISRPVLDPQGWDHDISFDGINVETSGEIKNVFTSIKGQISKGKHDFTIQSECAAAYAVPAGPTCSVSLDAQSSDKDIIYTVHSNAKLRNLKNNITECGVSLTSFGGNYCVGAKLEDTILIGKRLKFVMNAGRMAGVGKVAHGGGFEAVIRGTDYPMKQESTSLAMTVLSFNKEMVLGGSLQSELRLTRDTKVSVNANLNSRKMGQICLKMSSSGDFQIVLLAIFSIFKALLRRKAKEDTMEEELQTG